LKVEKHPEALKMLKITLLARRTNLIKKIYLNCGRSAAESLALCLDDQGQAHVICLQCLPDASMRLLG
jgi:hypothetical protein